MELLAMARCGAKKDRLEAEPAALGLCLHTPAGTGSARSANDPGILFRAYLQVIIMCWSTDKAVMENMRRSSCQDHKFAGIKQKKVNGMWFKKERKKERKKLLKANQPQIKELCDIPPAPGNRALTEEWNAASKIADLMSLLN